MSEFTNFPRQLLSLKAKNKSWRKRCVDWADSKTFFTPPILQYLQDK